MLSVILYGRNDSHGYNLHKRAAISLNCLARMLADPDDEIIFIDYNTPDDLPTFPEAIADTLTAEARRRLRIIRVRPRLHLPHAGRTHLSCLESQSRNVAIRRSNPANRWILSTNPDMIFAPRHGDGTFSAVLGDLADGCWHLPRFELPETFWEGFDRMDPAGIMAGLARDGHRLHLDEVVYGNEAALFDGHGDFQLMLRDDLHRIQGFDEAMISGWHVDSNMARRMKLLRGRIDQLTDHFVGYHCDHTRMASVSHGRDRLENDIRRFFDDVTTPELPGQAATWGLPDEELEELRLDRPAVPSMVQLLAAATTAPDQPYYEARCMIASDDLPHYPAEHVLPYLADVMVTMDRRGSYGWIGARPRMFHLFLAVWRGLGFTGGLVVPDSCRHLVPPDADDIRLVADGHVLDDADQFVFEFGAASQDQGGANAWGNDDMARLAPVRRAFFDLVELERDRVAQGKPPRRVITVNAAYNRFEAMITESLSATRTPFNTRIRQGFVIAAAPRREITPQELAHWLGPAMGRRQPAPITETVRVLSNLHDMLNTTPTPERLRAIHAGATSLLALLDHPAIIRREGVERLERVRHALEAGRPSTLLASRLWFPIRGDLPPPAEAPCRLATSEDWEDEVVVSLARRYFTGVFAANMFRRSCGLWARLALLAPLVRLGLAGDGGRLLVVAVENDEVVDIGTEMMGLVHVLDLSEDGLAHRPALMFRDSSRLSFMRAEAELAGGYDAVLFLRRSLFRDGPAGAARLLALASRQLRRGGMAGFIEEVAVSGSPPPGRCDPRQWLDDGFAGRLHDALGLHRLPAAPAALTRATVDSVAWSEPGWVGPHFLFPHGDGLATTFACVMVKDADPSGHPDQEGFLP